MADLKRIQHAISKGMKIYCVVEEALEDVIVVSLKYKTREFRGILLDSSERHLPPGLCFKQENSEPKEEGEKEGNINADGTDQAQTKDAKGVTLDCRYSYNNDPAKYNEQPLSLTSFISIRPARGKQVRNIRLRPRQTLCSKCKAVIHDSKSKSPSKAQKPEGESQVPELHPHNTRYRAAQAGKPSDPANAAAEGPTLRSGVRNRRADSAQATPKVLLENIRPRRDVKPTAKKKEADAALKSKLDNNKKNSVSEDANDSSSNSRKREDDCSHVILERSVSVDNPSALSQYNKQPVVRLDKSAVNSASVRTDIKDERQEKAPTLIVNMRSTPKITISYGGAGDRDVLKIQPRLPGDDIKSPDSHSTAEESPLYRSPSPAPSPPQRKTKKASKRTRDKQRYRIVNDIDPCAEMTPTGIKIGHHKKHKRKHRHRHASNEDENFNSDAGLAPKLKLPSLVTKLTLVPPANVNDLNGNEKRNDSDIFKDSKDATGQQGPTGLTTSNDISEMASREMRDEASSDFVFDDDPLNLKSLVSSPATIDRSVSRHSPVFVSPISVRSGIDKDQDVSLDQARSEASDASLSRSADMKPFDLWGSPVEKLESADFDDDDGIEAPSFQSDDSQEGIIGPIVNTIRIGKSPVKTERMESSDSFSLTPPPPYQKSEKARPDSEQEDEDKKEAVPYGTGVFEDLTPDEDEGDHDDHNVSQPIYQLPLAKKPRMMHGGWPAEGLPTSYLQRKAAGYGSSASVYSRSRLFNGPSSYYNHSPSTSSVYSSNPSAYSNSQTIQNSPTPIIQKSPVPIFNYNSTRYQGSPNRRFSGSPSRRYDAVGEGSSSRHHSVIDGALRQQSHSSLNRYPSHNSDQFGTARDGQPVTGGFHNQAESRDLPHSISSRYTPKCDSRVTSIRFPVSSEKNTETRYHRQLDSSSASVRIADSNPGTKVFRSEDTGSALRYVATTADTSSVPRFTVPLESNRPVIQFHNQSNSSALPLFSSHPSKGSLSKQYPLLGSTDSRFKSHGDSRYTLTSKASISSSPSPLTVQTEHTSSSLGTVPIYHGDSERKSGVLSGTHYETVDTSALFMAHSHGLKTGSSSDSTAQNFLVKPPPPSSSSSSSSLHSPVARVPSTDSVKSGNLFSTQPSVLNATLSFLRQDTQLLSSGTNSGMLQNPNLIFLNKGQSGVSSLSRRPSSSSLSQSHVVVNLSDSDDDADMSCVPGLPASSMAATHTQDVSHLPMMKIQAVNLANIRTEDGRDLRVQDVQWGKVQGFPWWPCRVNSIRMTHRDHREQDPIVTHVCHVSWFGSSTVSELSTMELRPFREEFAKRYAKKKRGPYQIAVQEAMQATGMTQFSVCDATRSTSQQPTVLGLVHDFVS